MNICVYGAASTTIDKRYIEAGEQLGKLMAKRGYGLVYGAGAEGMMGAVARGVESENGKVIGIVPDFFGNIEALNANCTELYRPRTMRERKQMLECMAEAYIITPGGIGTYDEFFEMLTLKQLGRHNKPLVILNTDGFYNKLLEAIEFAINESFIKQNCLRLYQVAQTPLEALECVEKYEKSDLSDMK